MKTLQIKRSFAALSLSLVPLAPAYADLEYELGSLVGYTILGTFTVTGHQDRDGKKSDDFDGCDFGRKIILDDKFTVTCQEWKYQYAYRPKAVMFVNGTQLKMWVDGDMYSVAK